MIELVLKFFLEIFPLQFTFALNAFSFDCFRTAAVVFELALLELSESELIALWARPPM